MVFRKYIVLLSVILLSSFFEVFVTSVNAQERRLHKIERRADKNFVRKRFSKAMRQYERALGKEDKPLNASALQLKIARLYFMIRDYDECVKFYASALEQNTSLLSVNDICNYIDALRFMGENKRAEAISLNHAYKDVFINNQRFKNTFQALSLRHDIQPDPAYSISKPSFNTTNSEFWIGAYGKHLFYALSYSQFNDYGKVFFHNTKYYPLNSSADSLEIMKQDKPRYIKYLRDIPVDMHNGPVAFSPNLDMMVGTVVEYDNEETTVEMIDEETRPFKTKLYYSTLSLRNKKFKKYQPIFDQDTKYSYAHPYLFNDGKSLLFASDMPGGYGGFDLYVTHWDEESSKWTQPVNLGSEVNTEGNEIYPIIHENRLVFSSNGLPGFGGYDLFVGLLDAYGVIPGSLSHLPAPINSVFNDFFMFPINLRTLYVASDRDTKTKDDIYYVTTRYDIGIQDPKPYYGLLESEAILGGKLLLNEEVESAGQVLVDLKPLAPEGLLLSLYFEFDSSELTQESMLLLEKFFRQNKNYQFSNLVFDGYSDEIGNSSYNLKLSERRAKSVACFLKQLGVNCNFDIRPHGMLKLDKLELEAGFGEFYNLKEEGGIDWIKANWKSRRVDIFNKR